MFIRFFRLGSHFAFVIEGAVDYVVCGFEVSNFSFFLLDVGVFFGDELAQLFGLGIETLYLFGSIPGEFGVLLICFFRLCASLTLVIEGRLDLLERNF